MRTNSMGGGLAGVLRRAASGAAIAALKTAIIIGTSTNTAPTNAATRYTPPCGGGSINAMWQSSASRPDTPVAVAGTFSNLRVRLPVALTAGQTWVWTLVKNGVDTGLTVTIDSTGLVQADDTHTVAVAAGDTICFKSAPAGTPNAQTIVQIACLFTAASGQSGPMFASWAGSAVGIGYGTPGDINSSAQAESSRRGIMPTAGTITTLMIATNTAPGAGQTRSVTLMKNGVDMLTATISDLNTTATATGSVTYAAGDLIQLRKVASATAASGLTLCGTDWQPATTGETILLSPGTGNFDSATTLFQNLNGTAENTEVTETNVYSMISVPATITKFRADCGTAPGVGKSRAFTIRKNGADQAGVITVQDAATSGTSAPNIAAVAGDLFTWKEVPTGTPAASNPVGASAVVVVT